MLYNLNDRLKDHEWWFLSLAVDLHLVVRIASAVAVEGDSRFLSSNFIITPDILYEREKLQSTGDGGSFFKNSGAGGSNSLGGGNGMGGGQSGGANIVGDILKTFTGEPFLDSCQERER